MIVPKNISDLPDDIRSIVIMINEMFDGIYLVGGAVRDSIIGRSTYDLDFASPDSVVRIKSILNSNRIFSIHSEGERFGTVSARAGVFDIQITTFREESYVNGSRKPIISVIRDIDSDLSRRDFTMNSIALSDEGIVDPYDGVSDINHKRIAIVGDADEKFIDDPLRIVRMFRFVSELGFTIDETTLKSAISHRGFIQNVSKERIGIELQKIIIGDYWDDAVSELVESKIFDSILQHFDMSYGVSPDDVYYEFSDYTADQLQSMDMPNRWWHLIRIIDHGRRIAGVQSINTEELARRLLVNAQISKDDKEQVMSLVGNAVDGGTFSKSFGFVVDKNDLIKLANSQKKNNDPRWMISMATYEAMEGKEDFLNSRYKKAAEHYAKSVEISRENEKYILESFYDRPTEKAEKLRGLHTRLRGRVRYYILADIFDRRLYVKYRKTKDLIDQLYKDHKQIGISKVDMYEIIEHVVSSVYKRNPFNITLEPFIDYLNGKNLHINKESIVRYKRDYIESKIRDRDISAKDKAILYLEKAQLSSDGKSKADLGFDYYDPYVDYLYSMMVSSTSIEDFNKYYDEFAEIANNYLCLAAKWNRLYDARRNMYLTSASSLIYAINIATSIEQRQIISERIVEDYREGRDIRNAGRYQIYLDWFTLVDQIIEDGASIDMVYQVVDGLISVNYVDEDELYFRENKSDLYSKRLLISETKRILQFIKFHNNTLDFTDPVFKSIIELSNIGLLDNQTGFVMVRNYIATLEKQAIKIDKVDIPDKILAKKSRKNEIEEFLVGESETLEYKSTWSFNLKSYRGTNGKIIEKDPELKREIIKNIAGMINKNGGIILIGVEDDSNICGLEGGEFLIQTNPDPRLKMDKIQQEIRNEIEDRLTKNSLSRVSINILSAEIDSELKRVIKIEVYKSTFGPVVYTGHDGVEAYFVRTTSSVDNLGMKAYSEAFTEFYKQSRIGSV